MKRILILQAGPDEWFRKAFATAGVTAEISVVHAEESEPLPEFGAFGGIVIGGSPKSVCAPEPWMMPLAETILGAAERGTLVLAVCFGHQLLATALGGTVVRSPKGREVGTVKIALTEYGRLDPILSALPPIAMVNSIHEDIVTLPPSGAVILAQNAHDSAQALRLSPTILSVQFHPELDGQTLVDLVRTRAEQLSAEGLDPISLAQSVGDSPDGLTLLSAWGRHVEST